MTEIKMMTADQARSYMDGSKPDTFTLLDVRQEWEYEENHIPGASLVPLTELPDRLGEVDRAKPVLVYCAAGGRSMAAANLLQGEGFDDISNLVGGFSSWSGSTAFGPMDMGMVVFKGTETPVEVVMKAYAMEARLQSFYVERADMAETMERIELFMELAGFEDRHKDTLYELYKRLDGSLSQDEFEAAALKSAGSEAEGGVEIGVFLEEFPEAFDSDQGMLQLSAMVEAQALDYYLRCARKAESDETREVLQLLAREEKAHLKLLGRFMDQRDL